MGIAKSITRFEEMIEEHPQKPQILAEGDSWFAIPTARNIIKQVNKLGKFNILNLASSGDEAMEMMTWSQKKKIHRLLADEDHEYDFKAFLFSGGGNDIVGPELWHLFKDYQDGMSALDCFNQKMLQVKMTQIEMAYRELLGIRDNLRPDLPVITHSYDRAIPNGKPNKLLGIIKIGPWMKPSLDERKIPAAKHQEIIDHLLGKLRQTLIGLENDFNNFYVADSFGVLEPDEWGDELHPNSDGFKKIVRKRWQPIFEQLGILP